MLEQVIQHGEGQKLEFKERMPASDKIAKTAIAFSNGGGGKLVIGVDDARNIVGISDDQVFDLLDQVSNILYDMCYPMIIPELYVENVNGKTVLVAAFNAGTMKPYYLKKVGKVNGVYVRVGATNRKADMEMIQSLERQRLNIGFDEEVVPEVNLSDLKLERVRKELSNLMEREIREEELTTLRLLKDGLPTRGLILLSYDTRLLEHARVRCARFAGNTTGTFIDQKDFDGPLYNQVQDVMRFVKTHVFKSGVIQDLKRVDTYVIPLVAIREALVNAIVHRDYSITGADIKLAIFDDRVEITSPGTLVKSLDVRDILSGRSEVRNKVIARVFKKIGYIEQWGSGIARMVEACKEAKIAPPEFRESGLFFTVILAKKTGSSDSGLIVREVPGKTYPELEEDNKVPDKVGFRPNLDRGVPDYEENKSITVKEVPDDTVLKAYDLSKSARTIYQYLLTAESISTKEAMRITGLTDRGVRKAFKQLMDNGLIQRVGRGPATKYILNEVE